MTAIAEGGKFKLRTMLNDEEKQQRIEDKGGLRCLKKSKQTFF